MNKYLRGSINIVSKLVISYILGTSGLCVLAVGYIVFPFMMEKTDIMISESIGPSTVYGIAFFDSFFYVINRHILYLIPLYTLIFFLALAVFVMFLMEKTMKRFDIEKIKDRLFSAK